MSAYDDKGALNGLFAPAYIHGNPQSEAAVSSWEAQNHALTPDMLEQTRMPDTTITNPAVGGAFTNRGGGFGGDTTQTIQGAIDPEALRILAQGGHYDMQRRRDAIAQQLMANQAAAPAADSVPIGIQMFQRGQF